MRARPLTARLILPVLSFLLVPLPAPGQPMQLWYDRPAQSWNEALPVGNGRLGAMVYGGVNREVIQFNEHTVWTGQPRSYAKPGAVKHLGPIRDLLWQGRQKEAEELAFREFMGNPVRQMAYQSFGEVLVESSLTGEPAPYRRELDLEQAIARTSYRQGGVDITREVLASHPASAILIRLTASQPVDWTLSFRPGHAGSQIDPMDRGLLLRGQVSDSAIRFEARVLVLATDGKFSGGAITGATSALLALTGATNFVNFQDASGDPSAANQRVLAALTGKTWDALLAQHRADHQRLFSRASLRLDGPDRSNLTTSERIRRFASEPDPQLAALLFQYGRYLLIGSSRPGGQPANLQGIWNNSNRPAWDSKYTVNINTEMNYWPANVTGLEDCNQPLFAALHEVAASGAITAREHYGARGWVLHHNFDLWRGTAPINASDHGIWPTGGAWLATHLWEHYLFTGDQRFLAQAYPLMKGAAMFFQDALVKHPSKGWLVSGPSNSPEQGGLVMGPTMDHQIVRALFAATAAAAQILRTDAAFAQQLTAMRRQIAPNQIGRHGQLQEWIEDKDDPKNQHRHVSHLWGLHPGWEITPLGTASLWKAARQSLEFRGDAATGWSMGWKVNFWARLLDGAHAYAILRNLITPAGPRQAGLYPNLFDAHPPFQIDGNFGVTAGIAEMLLQSQDPYATPEEPGPVARGQAAFLHLLPALPPLWPSGSVTGLRTRGGLIVDLAWDQAALTRATLRATRALPVTVRLAGREIKFQAQPGRTYRLGPDLKLR